MIDIVKIIKGEHVLPDAFYMGNPCLHNHMVNGKTLRYKTSKRCVQCRREADDNRNRRIKGKNRDLSALNIYEDMQLNKKEDYWSC